MSRDVNGNYSLPAGNPVVSGTLIQSAGWWNPTGTDIATALTDSLSRAGNGGMLAPLKGVTGSAGAPSFTFSVESTLGWYRQSAGKLSAAVGGVEVLDITGSTTDNVILQLPVGGSTIKLARSSDAALNFLLGSNAPAGADFLIQNTGGAGAKLLLGGNTISVTFNAVLRLNMSSTLTSPTQLYDPYNSINALKSIATFETGAFTGTLTGISNTPQTATFEWSRCGNMVTVNCATGVLQGTSNSNAMTITGLPANIQPARLHRIAVLVIDAGLTIPGYVIVTLASGTMTFATATGATYAAGTPNIGSAGFTTSGTKGIVPSLSFTYHLD